MQTRCPDCNATYQVSQAQLMAAHGLVRCGRCQTLFDGKLMILRAEQEDGDDTTPTGDEARTAAPVTDTNPVLTGKHSSFQRTDVTDDDENSEDDSDLQALISLFSTEKISQPAKSNIPILLTEELSPETQHVSYSKRSTIGWSIAILVLLSALIGQYTLYEHIELARYPTVHRICQKLGCNLTPARDLAAIELLHRGVTTHPVIESALLVTATIRNNAEFPQPYPDIQISLADLQGETIAMRKFSPDQYLPEPLTGNKLMEPGDTGSFKMEVWDPGTNVLAYTFDFF